MCFANRLHWINYTNINVYLNININVYELATKKSRT